MTVVRLVDGLLEQFAPLLFVEGAPGKSAGRLTPTYRLSQLLLGSP